MVHLIIRGCITYLMFVCQVAMQNKCSLVVCFNLIIMSFVSHTVITELNMTLHFIDVVIDIVMM